MQRKPSSVMRPLSKSRTCTSHGSKPAAYIAATTTRFAAPTSGTSSVTSPTRMLNSTPAPTKPLAPIA